MMKQLIDSIERILARETAAPLTQGLYLVATPIGNLADISIRALSVLHGVNYICCEDTRHSLKLLQTYGITTHLHPYHDHNAERQRPKILADLAKGLSIALISDAGTPLISDPGFKLVREVAAAGIPVTSVPGPSAVTTALAVSGLPTDSFFFAGFLPPKPIALRQRLEECAAIPGTLIFFETANRLDTTLSILGETYPGREVAIARELTKRFEEVIRAPLPYSKPQDMEWKGEFVLLVSQAPASTVSTEDLNAALSIALRQSSARDAVEQIARTFGVPRKTVYNLALQIQRDATHDDGN